MSQPFPAVLGGRWSALEGGYQSNDSNGLRLPSPTAYGNLAAWYDVSDYSSLVVDGSNRVSLIADKSGNSAVNCLCLPGTTGNYASLPDSAAVSPTTEIELVCRAQTIWTDANDYAFITKRPNATGQRSYIFRKTASGALALLLSADGTAETLATSSANVPFANYAPGWVKVTWRASDGRVQFFTATDAGNNTEPTFTQLGTNQTIAIAGIFDGNSIVEIGARGSGSGNPFPGVIYRAIARNTIGGTAALDANFATASKLATSFTESSSNAATVTINSSGDLGARISGERDLVQLTASKQPIYTAAAAGVGAYITFDGSDDYMKAAAFSLSQPDTIYLVGRQVSWTNNDRAYDGNAADTMTLNQTTASGGVSPQVGIYANSQTGLLSTWTLGLGAVMTALFNGASSALRLNRTAASSGNAGTASGNGFTLGSGGSGAGTNGNIRANEVCIYSAAHDTSVQDRVIQYAGRKWGISGV